MSLVLGLVQFIVLLALLFTAAGRQVEPASFGPVDSYVCIRAEGNPRINPGCVTNTIEKGAR